MCNHCNVHSCPAWNSFQNHRRLTKQFLVSHAAIKKPEQAPEEGFWKGFTINKRFYRSNIGTSYWSFFTKDLQKVRKPSALIHKVLFWLLGSSKKYSSRDTIQRRKIKDLLETICKFLPYIIVNGSMNCTSVLIWSNHDSFLCCCCCIYTNFLLILYIFFKRDV